MIHVKKAEKNFIFTKYRDSDFIIRRKVGMFALSVSTITVCIILYLIIEMILGIPYKQDMVYASSAILLLLISLFVFYRGLFFWASNLVLFILLIISSMAVFNGKTLTEQKIYNMAFLQGVTLFFSIMVATRIKQILAVGLGMILITALFLKFRLLPAAQGEYIPYYSTFFTMLFFTLMETGIGIGIFRIMNSALEESRFRMEHDISSGLPNEKKLYRISKKLFHQESDFYILFFKMENYNDLLLYQGSTKVLNILNKNAAYLKERYQTEIFRISPDTLCLVSEETPSMVQQHNREIVQHFQKPVSFESLNIQLCIRSVMLLADKKYNKLQDILDQGILALYQAKQEGKPFLEIEQSNEQKLEFRLDILQELADAIHTWKFKIYYQPIFNNRQEAISYEALCRWTRITGEAVPPSQFIPIIDQAGLMSDFFKAMVFQVMKDIQKYESLFNGKTVYINLSPDLINHGFDFNQIVEIIDRQNISHQQIGFELTETTIAEDPQKTSELIDFLTRNDFTLAMDDFGVGYSNLSQILKQKFKKIKFDRSLMTHISTNPPKQHLLQILIHFFNKYGYITLVEGIETEEEFQIIKSYGCAQFQGYYFGRPAEPDQLVKKNESLSI